MHMSRETHILPVGRVTEPPGQYFFGYYDKPCWNLSGRYILAQESSFADRDPNGQDPLAIGVIDTRQGNEFIALAQTHAWNWQQGCLLRWTPHEPEHLLMYNDFRQDHYVCVQWNLATSMVTTLPWPVYDITPDGRTGVVGNFSRVNDTRPGYGYACMPDPFAGEANPRDDGLYGLDLVRREQRLILSLADALEVGKIRPDSGHKAWFNHMTYNPSGTRMLAFHRWAPHAVPGHVGFKSRLLTLNADGSGAVALLEGMKISHYSWLDDEQILIWLENPERGVFGYYIVHDPSGEMRAVGRGLFESDGHCNLSPDRQWLLTDRYPQDSPTQPLILYDMARDRRIDIGRFRSLTDMNTSYRCDLHTRWSREGTKVCFDSTHEGSRQMYVIDVSPITRT
jgi:hypothetical protein